MGLERPAMRKNERHYLTLFEAVEDLKRRGYTDELTLTEDGLYQNALPLDPKEFRIDAYHRFEGPSDPADMSIVYAISSTHLGLKGLLVGGFAPAAMTFVQRMVQDLPARSHQGNVRPVQAARPGQKHVVR